MGRILDRAHSVEHETVIAGTDKVRLEVWWPDCLGCRMAMRKLGTMFDWNQITEWGGAE